MSARPRTGSSFSKSLFLVRLYETSASVFYRNLRILMSVCPLLFDNKGIAWETMGGNYFLTDGPQDCDQKNTDA